MRRYSFHPRGEAIQPDTPTVAGLTALGGTNLSTRLPFASAWKDDLSFALASFGVQSIRLAATEPEEYEWIVALQPQRSGHVMNRPGR